MSTYCTCFVITVVPALGDPHRERPPTLYGHFITMSRHISTLNYLRSADTCLTRTVIYWLSVPAIANSVSKCRVFGGHFNSKSLAHILTCDRQFAQISVLSSGDHKQYFISMPAWWTTWLWNSSIGYVRFTTLRRKCHVFCFQPAMSKNNDF